MSQVKTGQSRQSRISGGSSGRLMSNPIRKMGGRNEEFEDNANAPFPCFQPRFLKNCHICRFGACIVSCISKNSMYSISKAVNAGHRK